VLEPAWRGAPAPGGRAGGFTLLEILIVLVIITLLLAVVPPMLSGALGTVQLRAAARDLAAGLGRARSAAIASQQEATLVVDVESRSYQVSGERQALQLPDHVAVKLFTAKSELESDSKGAIRFFPDGSSTGGRVTLSHGDLAYLVDVDWLTGRVRILEEEEGA
jgi:general secretion pathway protein H